MKILFKDFLIKSKGSVGEYYFNAIYLIVSHPFSYFFVRLNVSPNQISLLSILAAALGGVLLFGGQVVIGLLLLILAYIFDFCDGNVARVWNKEEMARSEVDKKRGLALESLNTNVGLLALYGGLGFYLFTQTNQIFYLLLGFGAFAGKIIARYTRLHAYNLFSEFHQNQKADSTFAERYKKSLNVRIRFFLLKCLFAGNFYYVVYLATFLFLPFYLPLIFAVYAGLETVLSLIRIFGAIFKNYGERK